MFDEQLAIICQTVSKALIPLSLAEKEATEAFNFWVGLIEAKATFNADDEWINANIDIPKQFWNLPTNEAKNQWLTEWGRTQKVEGRGWYVFVQRKNLTKLKKIFDEREDSFQEMVEKQKEVKK